MTAKWASCALLAIGLAILAGCKASQPNLKPEIAKEVFVEPPMEGRYESSAYPKQAFDAPTDPTKGMSAGGSGGGGPGGMAGRGGMGGMGGGGMGAMGAGGMGR